MKEYKAGISLIILTITVIVMLILISVITSSAVSVINDGKKAAFAEDLTTIEDSVKAYYLTNGVLPIIDGIVYTKNDLLNNLNSSDKTFLQEELDLNNDNDTEFYELDLTVLGVTSTARGTRAEGNENDIYVINEKGTNVYYPLGVKVSNKKYFSKTSRLIKIQELNDVEDGADSVITISGSTSVIKMVKQQKIWTNSLNVLISTDKEVGETVRYYIAGVIADVKTISTISSMEPVTITISKSNMTANEIAAFTNSSSPNKKLVVQKLNSSQTVIAESILDISNLDIESPNHEIVPTINVSGYSDFNTISMSGLSDNGGSSVKEIRYIYTKKISNNGNIINLYTETEITNLINNGANQIKTIGYSSNTNSFKISKDIKETLAIVVDNAGNVSSVYRIVVQDEIINKVQNEPKLAQGMTPIKWLENQTLVETTKDDPAWYNYANKQWANAVSKDSGGNITAYWVWIPRYEYKIPFTHTSTAQTIDVRFLSGKQTTPTSGYIIHPAFTFGDVEVTGIWVAKFKSSGPHLNMTIKPGTTINNGLSIETMFNLCISMKTNSMYGWTTSGLGLDTHLMKNVEWGAAAYLSQSRYGKNGKIETVSNKSYAGGGTGDAYKANVSQSTTGNVYGIYDMSGGRWEYVAAYIDNGSSYLGSEGLSLVQADEKYKDVYKMGAGDTYSTNYEANAGKKGDAVYEISTAGLSNSSWYNDYSKMPFGFDPFFCRGGDMDPMASVGIFSFYYYNGADYGNAAFRPTLLVDPAL